MSARNGVSTAGRENGHRRPKGYADWNPHKKTRVLLDQVQEILVEYEEFLPLTVRQIFYRMVGAYGYEKTELAYARLAEALVRARRAQILDFEAIRDDGVVVLQERWFEDVAGFWDYVKGEMEDYRRDKQHGQRCYVELWCEAAGMMPQLAKVADDYSVPVYSCSGFSSLTAVRSIVNRAIRRNVVTIFLHVGDHDPSGESIFEAMTEDVTAFVERDRVIGTQWVVAERVALTAEQVARHDLPTSPAKSTDSRSAKWEGETCQLEALPPNVLADLVREKIESCLAEDVLEDHGVQELEERVQLLRALPSGESS